MVPSSSSEVCGFDWSDAFAADSDQALSGAESYMFAFWTCQPGLDFSWFHASSSSDFRYTCVLNLWFGQFQVAVCSHIL